MRRFRQTKISGFSPVLLAAGVVAVALWATPATALTPGYLAQMPSVADLQRKVTGSDPLDTAARQAATFKSLVWIVRALSAGGEFGNKVTPDETALMTTYGAARDQAVQQGHAVLAAQGLPQSGVNSVNARWLHEEVLYPDNEAFRIKTLSVLAPSVEPLYLARKGAGGAINANPGGVSSSSSTSLSAPGAEVVNPSKLIAMILFLLLIAVAFYLVRVRNRLVRMRRPVDKARRAHEAAVEQFHLIREDQVDLMNRLHGGDALAPYLAYQQGGQAIAQAAGPSQGSGMELNNVQNFANLPALTNSQTDRVGNEGSKGRREITEAKNRYNHAATEFNGELESFPTNLLAWLVRVRKVPFLESDVAGLQENARKVSVKAGALALPGLGASPSAPPLATTPAPQALPSASVHPALPGGARARGGGTQVLSAFPSVALRFLSGPLAGQCRPIGPGSIIGRDPSAAQIVVPDTQVSSGHAWIGLRGISVVFMDRGSTNGSIVNGAPVQSRAEIVIKPGDVVTLGRTNSVSFVIESV